MMSTPTASAKSMLAAASLLAGGVLILGGALLVAFGAYTLLAYGVWLGHSGGLVLLVYGAAALAAGFWAARRGKSQYQASLGGPRVP